MTRSKPSKSARKRQQQALQGLGEQLIGLDDEMLDSLALDESLRSALSEARRMKSHEALRRQKQYIGRLMRDVDPVPIRALLDRLGANERAAKRIFSNAERWRDRLLSEGRAALDAFATEAGCPQPELASLLAELARAHDDRTERSIQRRIFRIVHAALVAGAADVRIS